MAFCILLWLSKMIAKKSTRDEGFLAFLSRFESAGVSQKITYTSWALFHSHEKNSQTSKNIKNNLVPRMLNLGSSSAAALATLSSSSQVSCHFNSRNAAFRKQLRSPVAPLQCWGQQQLLPQVEAPQRRQCFVANAVWVIHFLWIFFRNSLDFGKNLL